MKTRNLFFISSFILASVILWVGFIFSYRQALAESSLPITVVATDKYSAPQATVPVVTPAGQVEIAVAKSVTPAVVKTSSDNHLVVASMNVNSAIFEGNSLKTLNKGLWRIPGSSTPDKGGNTVIAAHRWKWLPFSQKSFYDIDKVKVGDPISLKWAGKQYRYKVVKISTVTPDKVDVLNNSDQSKLTLFSCAPLFSSKYRLVVEAELIAS